MSSTGRGRFRRMVGAAVFGAGSLLAGCSSADADLPRAPRMVSAEPMAGGLHVSWINEEAGCDAVELERKTTASDGQVLAEFSLLASLPGAVDNKHDASATGAHTYTYRLRCKKAGLHSSYSNELGGVPGGP